VASWKSKLKNMYYVYFLRSLTDKGFYIGYTEDLRKRIEEHNQGKTKSIKHRVPFELIFYEAYKNKIDARKRELELKKKGYSKEQLLKRLENSLI
jgi:putative endonuclease